MSILEIKIAIRQHLTQLAEAAMANDYGTAGKHFDEIMKLTTELNNHIK